MKWFLLVTLTALASTYVLSLDDKKLKILVHSPSLGFSHMQFQGRLADLLVERGHVVDVLIPNWIPFERRNGTEKASVIRFHATAPTRYHELDFFRKPFESKSSTMSTNRVEPYVNCTLQFCSDMVKHPTFIDEIREKQYDVLIAEIFDPCIFYVAEAINIRVRIISSALTMPDEIAFAHGVPVPRSYIPSILSSSITVPVLTWYERLQNIFADYYHSALLRRITEEMRELFEDKFKLPLPSYHELLRTSSYIFINVHDYFDNPRPLTRKFNYIGGISIKEPAAEHPPSIEAIFQRAQKGVILFSISTLVNASSMPLPIKTAFVRAFARLPEYSVIWRFQSSPNDTELFAQAPNVFTVNWMDQRTILADNRTKLFISHCGQNSALEAAFTGTPVLSMPLFADQFYNTALLIQRGVSIFQDVNSVLEDDLVEKMTKLLNDFSYRDNSLRLSLKLNDEPFKPKERFVHLVEFAARHPNNEDLELYAPKLNFILLHNLDVYAIVLGISCLVGYAKYRIFMYWLGNVFLTPLVKKLKAS